MSELSDATVARLRESLARPTLPDRYSPVDVLGRGGMGVVWRAHDRLLERDVAVKILSEHIDNVAISGRLKREARILARLEHPGIVAVYDAGVLDDGRAWYAMQLVRGERLDLAAAGFKVRGDAVRVMMRIADTVAFAHAQGVIHRDLTPRNVMLGPFGEVVVLDWGVALQRSTMHETAVNDDAVVGTPGYMSPEQAAGRSADERSDIYGLGAILRDLLSVDTTPLPKPLGAIRDRALAPVPVDRYPDVAAFRNDLGRFQDGGRVEAYRESPFEAVGRLAYQYRVPLLLVLAYLVMRMAVLFWKGI